MIRISLLDGRFWSERDWGAKELKLEISVSFQKIKTTCRHGDNDTSTSHVENDVACVVAGC
jgi:hypothetical protein